MKLDEFTVGIEFYCGGNKWRCTDVGSRVVIAIKLGSRTITSLDLDAETGERLERSYVKEDPSWFNGPPYAVAENVFDEYSLQSCTRERNSDE
jgi:hypothetical protein